MKIHEYQAKEMFRSYGIPVPDGIMASTPAEAKAAALKLGFPVAIKAQVHAGGRGKAGGIKLAKSADEAEKHAQAILGMKIKWTTVHKVLVEKGADIKKEAYLGLIVDRAQKSISFICSAEGGVEIEEVAKTNPSAILRIHAFSSDFPEKEAAAISGKLFGSPESGPQVLEFMRKLFRLFVEKDCSLAEINPLVLTGSGKVIALDGKINFDDNALFRHPEVVELRDMAEENPRELEAKEKGLSFVELEGNVGCMVNGAGLAMATMDMINFCGGKPANFLDVGGSSNPEKVVHAFRLILSNPDVKAILINIFGGITRCDDIARGILEAFKRIEVTVPVVVRLYGTNYEEGMKLLEGTNLITAASLSDGVKRAVAIAKSAA